MGRSPGGNCFLRRIGRDKPDRAVMLYDDKTKERPTNTFYYRGGLKPSTVICEQVSTVSTDRVGELIGECSPEEMHLLDQCLRKSLGLKGVQQSNTNIDIEKIRKERDLYKDLYERLSSELLGK